MALEAEGQDWDEVLGPAPLGDGTYPATCTGARRTVTLSGNPAIAWTFKLSEGSCVTRTTPLVGAGALWAHEVTVALGLNPKGLRLSEAAGRPCVVVLKTKNGWTNVEEVRPA